MSTVLDLSKYKKPGPAAKALYKYLRKRCKEYGYNPDIEVWIHNPKQAKDHGYTDTWHVCWESGPYAWGIDLLCGANPFKSEIIQGFDNPNLSFDNYWSFSITIRKA